MFFKEKMLGKDQLEHFWNSTDLSFRIARTHGLCKLVCWFSRVVMGVGIGLIGEYDDAKDDAEILSRK